MPVTDTIADGAPGAPHVYVTTVDAGQLPHVAPPVKVCVAYALPDGHAAFGTIDDQPPPPAAHGPNDGAMTEPHVPAGHEMHQPAAFTAQQFLYSADATFGLEFAMHTPYPSQPAYTTDDESDDWIV